MLSHKEMTAHVRNRIKAAGIQARVKMVESCGVRWVYVDGATYEARFNEVQQREIKIIAQVNGLRFARGMAIDLDQMTNPQEFRFVLMPEESK